VGHAKKGDGDRANAAFEAAQRHTQKAERIASGKPREEKPEVPEAGPASAHDPTAQADEVGPDDVTPADKPEEEPATDPFATPRGGDPFAEEVSPEDIASPDEDDDIAGPTPEGEAGPEEATEPMADEAGPEATPEGMPEEPRDAEPETREPPSEAPGGEPEAEPEDEKPEPEEAPEEEATPETFVPASKQPHVQAAGAAASRTYSILRDEKAPEEARAAAQRAQDAAGEAAMAEGEGDREGALKAAEEAEQAAREAERLAGGEAAGEEEETPVKPGAIEEPEELDPEETEPTATERLDEEPDPEAETQRLDDEGEPEGEPEETKPYEPGEEPDPEAHVETEVEEPAKPQSFEQHTEPVEEPFKEPASDSEHAKFFHEEGEKARQQLNDLGGALQDAMSRAEQGDTSGADTRILEAASSMREVGARIERAINTALKEGLFTNVSEERHRQRLQAAMDVIQESEAGGGDPKKRAEALAEAIGSLRASNQEIGIEAKKNAEAVARINGPQQKALEALGSLKDRLDDIPDLSADSDWQAAVAGARESADSAKAVFEERLAEVKDEGARGEMSAEVEEKIGALEEKLKEAEALAKQKQNKEAYREIDRTMRDLKSMWNSFLSRLERIAAQEEKSLTPARMLVKSVMDRVLGRANTEPDSAVPILKTLRKSASPKTRAQKLVAEVMAGVVGENIFDQSILEPIAKIEKSVDGFKVVGSGNFEGPLVPEQPAANESEPIVSKNFSDQFFGMVMGSGPKQSLPGILKPQEEPKEEDIEKTAEEESKLPSLGSTIPQWARPFSNVAAPNPKSKRMQ
jgi:hypothetical protein